MPDQLSFFGFSDEPFRLTPDTDFYYPSSEHEKVIRLLNYFLEDGDGFAMVIGAPGTGKTTLLRKFLSQIPQGWDFAFLVSPMLTPEQLLKMILSDLGLKDVKNDISENLKLFQDYIVNLAKWHKKLLLVIDEAQSLPVESLEQVRLLSNIELKNEKPLQIILSGQPELEKKVKQQITQLNQRITVRCYLQHLSKKETKEYVLFRMAKANGSVKVEESAMRALYVYSRGIPRLINSIMKRALIMAYSESRKYITKKDITKAALSLDILERSKKRIYYLAIGIGFAIVLAIVIIYFLKIG